jgi:hypothetical protein
MALAHVIATDMGLCKVILQSILHLFVTVAGSGPIAFSQIQLKYRFSI